MVFRVWLLLVSMFSRFIDGIPCMSTPNNVLLYAYATFYVSMLQLVIIWDTCVNSVDLHWSTWMSMTGIMLWDRDSGNGGSVNHRWSVTPLMVVKPLIPLSFNEPGKKKRVIHRLDFICDPISPQFSTMLHSPLFRLQNRKSVKY